MTVFTGALVTETCTFSPVLTELDDFELAQNGRLLGAVVRDVLLAFGKVATAAGVDVVQGLGAGAMPAGKTRDEAYAKLKSKLLADLEAAGAVEAGCLFLHGAMVAESEDDCEGDLLEAVRGVCGVGVTVGVLIDPHAHLSERMTNNADIIVAFKEWPHIDILDRANETMALTLDAAQGRI